MFISYARADGYEIATNIHANLQDVDVPAWIDVFNIPEGSDWDTEIDKGLRSKCSYSDPHTCGHTFN